LIRIKTSWKALLILAAAAILGSVPATAQENVAAGKRDYEANCASCHGKDGRGHGDALNVIPVNPPDLTRIAKNNGGVFPASKVADFIDGRVGVPSHSRFDMQFWGAEFQQPGKEFTPESEAKAKARIENIVSYLKTIQTH